MAQEARLLRWSGLVGIAALLLLCAADVILVYTPLPASEFDIYAAAVGKPRWRLLVGSYLGVLVIPFVLVGLFHIYLAILPAGAWFSKPPVLIYGYGYIIGAVFHGTIPFFMAAVQTDQAVEASFLTLFSIFEELFFPLRAILSAMVLAGSIWLFGTLLLRETLYPRWMAWLSPLVIILVFRIVLLVSPPEMTGVLLPAGSNLAGLIFLTASTLVLWRTKTDQMAPMESGGQALR